VCGRRRMRRRRRRRESENEDRGDVTKGERRRMGAHLDLHGAVLELDALGEEGGCGGGEAGRKGENVRWGGALGSGDRSLLLPATRALDAPPIVVSCSSKNSSRTKRSTRQLLPTPEFPSSTSLKWNCPRPSMLQVEKKKHTKDLRTRLRRRELFKRARASCRRRRGGARPRGLQICQGLRCSGREKGWKSTARARKTLRERRRVR
jgi:hypothetical protein